MRNVLARSLFIAAVALIISTSTHPVAAASPITKISLDPATATISSETTETFKVIATAADGSTVDVTDQSTLSTNDPLGTISGFQYTPGKSGEWLAQASYQSFTATAAVTVTPGAVTDLVLNPNSDPEVVTINTTATFIATAYDMKNNVVSGSTVVWSVIGDIGSIDDNGVFTAKNIGTGKIQAMIGLITAQVSVEVRQPIITNTSATNANTAVPATNRNTNIVNVNSTITKPSATTSTTPKCTTLRPWAWTMLLFVFLVVVALIYGLVPVMQIWPAAIALIGSGILAYIQRKYACDLQPWWAWVVTLGTILITGIAIQSRPQNPPSASKV